VFGGSFNPIHFGHLLVADEVCETLDLDRVIFVPAGVPPHKPPAELAPAADRHAMAALATQEHPRFEVSAVELERPGPSYTVDTLTALSGRGELFLLVGSETFLDLLSWRRPHCVTALARLVVMPRSRHAFDPEAPTTQNVLQALGLGPFVAGAAPIAPGGPIIVDAASLPISGSDLRRRAREGRSLAYRMPQTVAAYIRDHGLYRGKER
jgi:nicotinate-nucleotide adenylyltransferase